MATHFNSTVFCSGHPTQLHTLHWTYPGGTENWVKLVWIIPRTSCTYKGTWVVVALTNWARQTCVCPSLCFKFSYHLSNQSLFMISSGLSEVLSYYILNAVSKIRKVVFFADTSVSNKFCGHLTYIWPWIWCIAVKCVFANTSCHNTFSNSISHMQVDPDISETLLNLLHLHRSRGFPNSL